MERAKKTFVQTQKTTLATPLVVVASAEYVARNHSHCHQINKFHKAKKNPLPIKGRALSFM
ncbi:MAG: hypothetical protein RIS47_1189 [Bacteroidota bacterium]|jgi:hypothetical protein